mmetsp:Transcript_45891/g.103646  ORF Transcript_45891/g.103646 Transcript_45891/m.103646 type:complete len:636 (+) Transcript_45891:187-2094(+)
MTRRRLCLGCLFTTLACLRSKALSFNPFDKALTSVVKRPQFESLVSERFGKQTRVEFVPDDTSPAATQAEIWRWAASIGGGQGSMALGLGPATTERDGARLAEMLNDALFPHASEAISVVKGPVIGLAAPAGLALEPAFSSSPESIDPMATRARMKNWVLRTLVGLKMCPFTGSAEISGVRLEDLGVTPAPILYQETPADSLADLMSGFWDTADRMLAAGPEGCSSIILSAPSYDARWLPWYREVFPALEASVLCSGLGRTLGIVCFHPDYHTPEAEWLRRHRFGHMYSAAKLRAWAQSTVEDGGGGGLLSELAALDDEEFGWFGGYMRRSPHAMVNVLWSAQLEAAELRRDSENLYVRNLKRLVSRGRRALQIDLLAEIKGISADDLEVKFPEVVLEIEASEKQRAMIDTPEAPEKGEEVSSSNGPETFTVGEKVLLVEEDEDVTSGALGVVLGYTDEGLVEVDFPEIVLEVEATLIKLAAPSPLPTAAKQEEPTAEKDAMVEPFEVGETVSLTDEDEDVALGTMGTVLGYTDEGFIEVDFPEAILEVEAGDIKKVPWEEKLAAQAQAAAKAEEESIDKELVLLEQKVKALREARKLAANAAAATGEPAETTENPLTAITTRKATRAGRRRRGQ